LPLLLLAPKTLTFIKQTGFTRIKSPVWGIPSNGWDEENRPRNQQGNLVMNDDALTMTQEGLVGEIYDIAAKWRSNPHLRSYFHEIARYDNVRAALKLRFALDMVIKDEHHFTDYRAALAISSG
jgi:hypothetical protein